MSKLPILKTSAILVSLSLLISTAYPAFAQDSTAAGTARRQLIQQKINIKQERVENKAEALKEKVASKTAALRLKLQVFKDQKKAGIAERINSNLNRINQNQTEQMQKHLDTMSAILDKLENRVNQANPDIKDPAAAKAAITKAREIIATTSAAVQTQEQKDYTIQVTSEARIKTDIKAQRDKLHTDLLALRKMIIEAKQSVATAIRTAKAGPKPANAETEKEGTNSGQQ